MFYNPMEQLVLEQFSAEPPFGGSNIINASLFNTPYLQQDGTVKPNPFSGIINPPAGQDPGLVSVSARCCSMDNSNRILERSIPRSTT